ncbi:sn-glycerol-3-phosphate ABC transporter ATP-binding protein UgpC [Paracoccus aestuarii]|uniref:sn-glycerol-3-phosphate ABC transporter ATP-binding protein UgpC n=1 Tax=Paracoccus aestuarii TaxID=453842 RepID=A0A418ZZ32_9RHOB|nr:sn-glycerol-3-phosphate ABC transporter ATP-binding protein UgpC [Paracoccus aestuarii]RJL05813.1 sn-glycerol-3-phosphate ABC transporter ATP-binding protein UgpC [Paracoccus aestuarii]WCR01022.1 sn-glycerol-3-phosphate ABC transporter ATP-binding protein UgpC [Paracoccus aestuarii]
MRDELNGISVSIRDLSLGYGAVRVLSDLNLDVRQGEFLVLLGASGCGKSTLLNCIAGLQPATEGQVFIGGWNVTWAEPSERGIGMVFQSYALYPQMTVEGNLSFGLKNARVPRDEIRRRVARAAETLQLEPLLKRKPAALSGGQRQRVAIGRALVRDVDVFLFDEPLSNLDAKLRAELRVELKRLHQNLGNTMIYVTHDQIEAMTLADRIAIMRGGAIQQLATPDDIYRRPANLYVAGFIGSPPMNLLPGRLEAGRFTGPLTADVAGYDFAAPPRDGKVVLGIRPEHVRTGPAAEALPIRAQVDVEVVEPMGADTLVWARLGQTPFRVRMDGEDRVRVGDRLAIGCDPVSLSLFDAATEARL